MTLNWGYLIGTALFLSLLVIFVILQIAAKRFHPYLYWTTIVASTTAGTTMADFADRSLGIGYAGGSTLLFFCLMATLGAWYWSLGSISVTTVDKPSVEAFYWVAITLSQTLGTALGDWLADIPDMNMGRLHSAGDWRCLPPHISGPTFRGSFFSGRHSSCRDRSEPPSAIFSINLLPTED